MRQVSLSASGVAAAEAGSKPRLRRGGSAVEAPLSGKGAMLRVKSVADREVSPEVRWNRGGIRPVSHGAEGGGKRKSP